MKQFANEKEGPKKKPAGGLDHGVQNARQDKKSHEFGGFGSAGGNGYANPMEAAQFGHPGAIAMLQSGGARLERKGPRPIPGHLVVKAQRLLGVDLSGVTLEEDPALAEQGKRGVAEDGQRIRLAPGGLSDMTLIWHEIVHLVQQQRGAKTSTGEIDMAETESQHVGSPSGPPPEVGAPTSAASGAQPARADAAEPQTAGGVAEPEAEAVAGAQALAAGEAFEVRATAAGVMYQEEDEAGTVEAKSQTAEEERDPVRKSQHSGLVVKAYVKSPSTWTDAYVGEISAEGAAEVAAMNKLIPQGYQIEELWLPDTSSGDSSFRLVKGLRTVVVAGDDVQTIRQAVQHEATHALFHALKELSKSGEGEAGRTLEKVGAIYGTLLEFRDSLEPLDVSTKGNLNVLGGNSAPKTSQKGSPLEYGGLLLSPELEAQREEKEYVLATVSPANWGEDGEHPWDNCGELFATTLSAYLSDEGQVVQSVKHTLAILKERYPDRHASVEEAMDDLLHIVATFKQGYVRAADGEEEIGTDWLSKLREFKVEDPIRAQKFIKQAATISLIELDGVLYLTSVEDPEYTAKMADDGANWIRALAK